MTTQSNGDPSEDQLTDEVSDEQVALDAAQQGLGPPSSSNEDVLREIQSLRRELRTNQGANTRTQKMIENLHADLRAQASEQKAYATRDKILAVVPEENREQVDRYLGEILPSPSSRVQRGTYSPEAEPEDDGQSAWREYFRTAINWVRAQGVNTEAVPVETWNILNRPGYDIKDNEADFTQEILSIKRGAAQTPRSFGDRQQNPSAKPLPGRRANTPPASQTVNPPVAGRPQGGVAPPARGSSVLDAELDKLLHEAQSRDRG